MKSVFRSSVLWLLVLLPALSAAGQGTAAAPGGAGPAAENRAGRTNAPYPERDRGYVTDKAGVLSPDQKDRLNAYCYTTEKETGAQIAVVVIQSMSLYPGTANTSIETFARGLFDSYGVGNMPKNDGVLLLVAINDRKARIELGGHYGRGRDADAQRIIDGQILPRFRKGDYAGGITNGTRAIILEFAGLRIGPPWMRVALGVAAVVLIAVCVSLFRTGKRGWGWVVVGMIIVLIILVFKTGGKAISSLPEGRDAGGFGGGFGGGSSGGGGASGSW